MHFLKIITLGARYMEIWPDEPLLGAVFPENRIKYAMKWARQVIPPGVVLIVVWVYIQGGGLQGISWLYTLQANWPLAAAWSAFLLLLPVQGYYWFGRRALLGLTPAQQTFYAELCAELGRQAAASPTMYDLALALQEGCRRENRDFLNKL